MLSTNIKKTVQIGKRHGAASALAQRFVVTVDRKTIDGDDAVAVERRGRQRNLHWRIQSADQRSRSLSLRTTAPLGDSCHATTLARHQAATRLSRS